MTEYKIAVPDRKVLVKRIEELTGLQRKYTHLPECAFIIGAYKVTKEGMLEAREPDADLISTLIAEGLIDAEAEQTAEEPAEEIQVIDAGEFLTGNGEKEAIKPNLEFPMDMHNGASLRNLLNLIHSRGSLISKATGGKFAVDDGFIEFLKTDFGVTSAEEFMEKLSEYEEEHGSVLTGISITGDRLTFTGFPPTPDDDEIDAFKNLAIMMNRQAITQKRIQPKPVDESNEKYAFRIWMIRIGLNGDDYKQTRKYLLKRLNGHTSFRTQADADRWRAKREEMKKEA